MKRLLILTLFLPMLLLRPSAATAQEFYYHHIGVANGLSHYSVLSIYIDEQDLIWMGTSNGLNLWSGYDCTVYKTLPDDPSSLFCDNIQRITGDRKGKVWIQTIDGVAEFDVESNTFSTIATGEGFRAFYADELYLAQDNRISRYRDGKTELVYSLCDSSVEISTLFVDPEQHTMLVGTLHHGMYLLRQNKDTSTEEYRLIPEISVTSIFRDLQGRFWIGTTNDGLYLSEDSLASFENFRYDKHDPGSVSSNFIRTFCEDANGKLYIGTFDGFNTFEQESRSFGHYTNLGRNSDIGHTTGIESTSVWCIACDRQNNLWIGTFFEGIYSFNPEHNIYRKYTVSDNETMGLSSSIVSSITEDEHGDLYIATEAGGFCHYDRTTGRYKQVRHLDNQSQDGSYNNIKSFYYDRQRHALWLGTHMGGLFRYDTQRQSLRQLPSPLTKHATSRIVRQIVPWHDKLLLATHAGLWVVNPEAESFDRLPGFDYSGIISDICLSESGAGLWIAGDKPLLYYYSFADRKIFSHRFGSETSLSGDLSVSHLYEDSAGRIWVCTENDGVYLFHTDSRAFEHLNNFTSNKICSVAELPDGRFIITASNGINVLDYDSRDLLKQQTNRELPLQMINQDALFIASDGTVFVGGTDGMISFRVANITANNLPTRIFPMQVKIDGRDRGLSRLKVSGDGSGQKHSLKLAPRFSAVSIKYAIPNLSFVSMNLEYRLNWHKDEKWVPMPNDNTINLINLQPAWYTLQVRAIDKNGKVFSMHTCELRIVPPWYNRWWSYILFMVAFGTLLAVAINIYINHIELRTSLEYERKQSQDQDELGKSKLRFFTNVAHEFRTPLTIIIGHIESLLQSQLTPKVYKKLMLIYKSSMSLQDMTSELLDFRKHEQGYMKIHASENDLVRFLCENYTIYREYAATRSIEMVFEPSEEKIMVWYDESQIQKVINNLLSNALKYTDRENGRVVLSAATEDGQVVIRVEDNGNGIPADEIESIFKRFYRTDTVHVGTGIGLALTKEIVELHGGTIEVRSVEHRGSSFTVRLPLGREHLTDEQTAAAKDSAQQVITMPEIPAGEDAAGGVDIQALGEPRPVDGKKFRMLVVEDNEQLRTLFTEIFSDYYDVEIAVDGIDALERIKKCAPDIIVSDIVMPRMNGFELCKAVKTDFDTSHIPFIALTAYTSTANNILGFQIGADDYITKPFHANVLLSRCNNLINSRIVLKEKFCKQQHVEPQNLVYTSLDRTFMDRAMAVIEANIQNPKFDINQFAKEMAIARTKLFVKLKAISGQTPFEFIMTIKLRRAADMLLNNAEYNVTDICELLGFNTLRYFSKCFKDKYHISPLQYRRNRGRVDSE